MRRAAITLHDPAGSTDTIVAVMRKPAFRAGVMRATMQVLTSERAGSLTGNPAVHGVRHDANGIPARLGSVSVFIDDVLRLPRFTAGREPGSPVALPVRPQDCADV
jgi:hypothetical protein